MNCPAQPDASLSRSAAMDRIWMLGIALWSSLLAACLASLLFFAAVDPLLLRDAGPRLFDGLEREGGYALGFFFFWFIATCASTLSLYLARTSRPVARDAVTGADEH